MITLIYTVAGLVVGGAFGYVMAHVEMFVKAGHKMMWGDGPRRPELLIPGDWTPEQVEALFDEDGDK